MRRSTLGSIVAASQRRTYLNHHMTDKCKHGHLDICDYCLIAYGDHVVDRKTNKWHYLTFKGKRERFRCASCKEH